MSTCAPPRIYLVNIGGMKEEHDTWRHGLAFLPEVERSRVTRFRHRADRERALSAALLSRYAVARTTGLAPDRLSIDRTTLGRPYLAQPHPLLADFNVSHHGEWVGCAVVRSGRVGLDIVTTSELAQVTPEHILNASERPLLAMIQDLEEQTRFLAILWVAKEAYLKKMGTGITVEPSTVALDLKGWRRNVVRLSSGDPVRGHNCTFDVFDHLGDILSAVCWDACAECEQVQAVWELVSWDKVMKATVGTLGN